MNDDKSNGGNKSLQPKDSNKKKATKFICDIEAALAGEISDMEDERGQVNTDDNKFNKLSNDDAMTTTSASLAEETIRKVYVVHLEDTYAWVRLSDDIEPPCFDQVYVIMKAIQPLQREELLPGTPCVVLARFNPRDIVNDGTTAREVTEV
ncbi:hypothetical protein WUBG_10459 [Wuchereria bancrofti]|uniref:Uncharacterized protein n=1 Tax=Wuchereria bancrofti TaxID=6293 RepID=J9AVT8_WUCBA|nr:hypothetical protein WUBG_10459 [Wuchereria bancrofti]